MRLRRSPRLPAEVRDALPLTPGERVLGAAVDAEGRWWAGTPDAFLVPVGSAYRRIPWQEVEHARWDRDSDSLVVEEVAPFGQPRRWHRGRFADAGQLLRVVRERVTASVVLKRFVPVEGRRGLTVIGRRAPGGAGPVEWAILLDPVLSPDDPLVRVAAEQALQEAQRELAEP